MREFSFFLLFASALVPTVAAYRDRDRLYQLPFLYSMGVVVYILPTLFGTLENQKVLTDVAYIKYCLFSTVCFWSGLLGYWSFFNTTKLRLIKRNVYDPDKMSYFLYAVMMAGFLAVAYIGGFDVSDRYGGAYAILLYPARALRPATIMLAVLYLIKPSKDKLSFLIISLLFSLKIILIDGRRSELFNLFITIAFPLFFIKGIRAPRKFIAPAILGAIIVFTFLPAYRNYTLKGDFNSVFSISPIALISSYIAGESSSEVVEAARNLDIADNSQAFNYGTTLYNSFVYQFASSTIFGKATKESLMISSNLDLSKLKDKSAAYGGDEFKNYLASTGFASVFFEFGYFGFVLFFLFGYLTKKYYVRAILKNEICFIMFYCFFATFILSSIYDSMLYIPTFITLYLLVYWGARKYSRVKGKKVIINGF